MRTAAEVVRLMDNVGVTSYPSGAHLHAPIVDSHNMNATWLSRLIEIIKVVPPKELKLRTPEIFLKVNGLWATRGYVGDAENLHEWDGATAVSRVFSRAEFDGVTHVRFICGANNGRSTRFAMSLNGQRLRPEPGVQKLTYAYGPSSGTVYAQYFDNEYFVFSFSGLYESPGIPVSGSFDPAVPTETEPWRMYYALEPGLSVCDPISGNTLADVVDVDTKTGAVECDRRVLLPTSLLIEVSNVGSAADVIATPNTLELFNSYNNETYPEYYRTIYFEDQSNIKEGMRVKEVWGKTQTDENIVYYRRQQMRNITIKITIPSISSRKYADGYAPRVHFKVDNSWDNTYGDFWRKTATAPLPT